jgi:hypothetical protein
MAKSAEEKLEGYMRAIASELVNSVKNPDVRTQLEQTIDALWKKDKSRAYLALRGYLRYPPPGKTGILEDHWVWSEAQAQQYLKSKYFTTVLQPLLDKVNREFINLNVSFGRKDAFSLRPNTNPRSLTEQRNNWLKSFDPAHDDPKKISGIERIYFVAEELKKNLLTEIADSQYDDDPAAGGGPAKFKKYLTGSKTNPHGTYAPLTYATPGLSAHGQAKAFDFIVVLGGKTVAGTEGDAGYLRKTWRNDKWDEQLKKAIRTVDPDGKTFDGPLASPDEPWHYYYKPTPPANYP